jgi:hypothetical protein
MPLKDLTVKGTVLREKQVEELVSDYVRYDPDAKEIVLLPATHSLKNKAKILIYLVALQGWPFVTKDPVPTDATPASLEHALHIQGGTLRHALKELKDSHMILVKGRSYSIHPVALTHIKDAIQSGK